MTASNNLNIVGYGHINTIWGKVIKVKKLKKQNLVNIIFRLFFITRTTGYL